MYISSVIFKVIIFGTGFSFMGKIKQNKKLKTDVTIWDISLNKSYPLEYAILVLFYDIPILLIGDLSVTMFKSRKKIKR